MAPRPSSKKWGEKKINADTRNTLDSPIEMHVAVPNCGNFFFLPFLLIFKDLINQPKRKPTRIQDQSQRNMRQEKASRHYFSKTLMDN